MLRTRIEVKQGLAMGHPMKLLFLVSATGQPDITRMQGSVCLHLLPIPPPKRSLLQRIFSSHTMPVDQISDSLTPGFNHPVPPYTKQEVLVAYLHPALAQRHEVIWLARRC
ncbi:hypothetical protein BU25DRAFT_60035 [Macroventuria anomochaeta]|uniref:Uncharacterized protein n=1 Tax=Macroventuria anomochaeta TaxID=301207 RepID=A0ACB6S0Q8_9PLEO|nr:uncharacterized protein BU25DRAFT_60035 [Macroventuria anomochaeta]KAF2627250.1 hypothetical protein BU25DRAFT_60035 [Macroventuria anomochaeta]